MNPAVNRSPRHRPAARPATAVPLASPGGQLLFNAAVLSVAWAGQQVLAIQMPQFPKISFPKISFPTFGKKDEAAPGPPQEVTGSVSSGPVKVRAAASPQSTTQAPTLSESTGKKATVKIGSADGWKRFPARRMPGANMDPWKDISREITPKF